MAKRIVGPATIIDWRAQLPLGLAKARGAWRVFESAQVINWRAQMGPTSTGGGSPITALTGEADGLSSATVELTGPPIRLDCETDGQGNAQCSSVSIPTIHGECDGIGMAQIYLQGGVVSIACLTQGFSGASPPSPGGSIGALADTPYSY